MRRFALAAVLLLGSCGTPSLAPARTTDLIPRDVLFSSPERAAPQVSPDGKKLAYLAPRDGRPAPADLRANDLAHWETRLETGSADNAWQGLLASRALLVSPGVVTLSDAEFGFRKGLMARDPDGHAVQLVER